MKEKCDLDWKFYDRTLCVLLQPSNTDFKSYEIGKSDLHVAIFDGNNSVFSFCDSGIHQETPDKWESAINILSLPCLTAHPIYNFMQIYYKSFRKEAYSQHKWNCFDFVIEFLRFTYCYHYLPFYSKKVSMDDFEQENESDVFTRFKQISQLYLCGQMASWCADNLYDVKQWKEQGLELTCSSNEAAKMFDAVLRQLVSWIDCEQLGGIIKSAGTMLELEPDFVMGNCLTLAMDAMGNGRSVLLDKTYKQQLQGLVGMAEKCTLREQKHVKAINYFAYGEMRSACVEWEKILAEHPTDLMAIKFSHDAYFFMGDSLCKRDSVERVITKWNPATPMYSYLHGMYAFGLEECADYSRALKHGKMALELNRQDCWATHAIAHCYEMEGKFEQGISFMESSDQDWSPCWMLACHNYWHNALFHIEKGDFEAALAIFDSQISERTKASQMMLDMVDATSLLLRLEMEGVEVGQERWKELLGVVEPHLDDHILAFNDAHISMALSKVGTDEMRDKHSCSITNFVSAGKGHDNWRITRDLGEQLCESIVDFNQGRCDAAFEKLYPIRSQIFQIGGSHAQRDVFTQVLIHAGFRSSNAVHKNLAVKVIEEREKLKPKSAVADRLLAKHNVGHK